ncbi:ABC transporter ATP-binding protein [Rhodococcus sp. WS1]|uniref:ABC transporter ATP-binding protein n=1 Tax=unclassified Rhodococcus (in: high G+C Gram-positive bacteria) TaxID=192944 RepID=UPI001144029B|nr:MULTISPECIES: ABC transporter ATP-binding protein [unclassified Rhodococcus (in: high G+C Gram-positive bacteria)]ROZ52948.1 ABC transporter ATP-binding protein [Rhodococcus sp. WS1]TQC36039.1 ABC transporter ATP-binding protein [Rhodococcus sp. WS7]
MSLDPKPLLDVRNLDVSYGRGAKRRQILDDVSFRIAPGEALGLIGETGSGKSTIARAVLGLIETEGGKIHVDDHDLTTLSRAQWRQFRREGIVQYVFQDPLRSLDPERTIAQSLAEPLEIAGVLGRGVIRERVAARLATVALDPDILPRFPGEISGGQRQRVAVARALITDPRLIILDEPVSALDSANRVNVIEILASLRDSGATLLFISHDLGSVAGVTDRLIVLYRGRVVEEGSTADVLCRPEHPYSRLLVGSAPTLRRGAVDRTEREELRRLLTEHPSGR